LLLCSGFIWWALLILGGLLTLITQSFIIGVLICFLLPIALIISFIVLTVYHLIKWLNV
jgi:hypothetical protein